MNTLLRFLNTLLLAGILATQVLILLHIRQPIPPIQVEQPISVEGWRTSNVSNLNDPDWMRRRDGHGALPIPVEIIDGR
jgi:hypothetical protein